MQIGFVGLGRMGGNMVRRLMKAGHKCVVFDINADARKALAKDGATDAPSLEKLVEALSGGTRAVWVMLPAGKITEETVEKLGDLLSRAAIFHTDAGRTLWEDAARANMAAELDRLRARVG